MTRSREVVERASPSLRKASQRDSKRTVLAIREQEPHPPTSLFSINRLNPDRDEQPRETLATSLGTCSSPTRPSYWPTLKLMLANEPLGPLEKAVPWPRDLPSVGAAVGA
jgi:hypothetical protein